MSILARNSIFRCCLYYLWQMICIYIIYFQIISNTSFMLNPRNHVRYYQKRIGSLNGKEKHVFSNISQLFVELSHSQHFIYTAVVRPCAMSSVILQEAGFCYPSSNQAGWLFFFLLFPNSVACFSTFLCQTNTENLSFSSAKKKKR